MFKKIILTLTGLILSFNIQAENINNIKPNIDYIEETTKQTLVSSEKPVFVDFFWYGCGHCYSMKPQVKQLVKKHEKNIVSKSYPATFENWKSGSQIFFTLESLNRIDSMHDKIFDEIHLNKKNILKNENLLLQTIKSYGINEKDFQSVYSSFSTQSKVSKAMQITKELNIESTPYFVIYYKGKTYKTSPGMTGSYEKTIATLDYLLSNFTRNTKK